MDTPYISPKTKKIKLDTSQAILTACQVGGIFFEGTSKCGNTAGSVSSTVGCSVSIKTVGGATTECTYIDVSSQPS